MNRKHPPYNLALQVSGHLFIGLALLVVLRVLIEALPLIGIDLSPESRSQLQDWFDSLLKVGSCMGLSTLLIGSIWSAL